MNSSAALSVNALHTWIANDRGIGRILDEVSFELNKGECLVLVGESGSGKSMTALSLLRLLPDCADIVEGSIQSDGKEWLDLPEKQFTNIRGRKIAMIFQEPSLTLDPIMTIGDQINEVLIKHTDLTPDARKKRILDLLTRVGIREADLRIHDYPFALSGGMKQRVMIAMALAAEPDILIADEPTTALDVTVQAQVLSLLDALKKEQKMAMLLITHDLGVAHAIGDRIAVMYAGEIVESAKRSVFFKAPGHPYSRRLFSSIPDISLRGNALPADNGKQPALDQPKIGCLYHPRCEFSIEACQQCHPVLRQVADRAIRCIRFEEIEEKAVREIPVKDASASLPFSEKPILSVKNLKVHFPIRRGLFRSIVGYNKAVDGVNLTLFPGRTLVLVGESGSGKTTVGKSIVRLIKPTSGTIELNNESVWELSGDALKAFRKQVQIIFQDPFSSLNPRMRIREVITEGLDAVGLPTDTDYIDSLMQAVGLDKASLDRYPHEFSGGQRQRIAIARAIAVKPSVIVCDEPTSALDVSVQAQILNLLKALQKERQMAYLFITHNWGVVEYLADDIAVMYLGKIVESGPAIELLQAPAHPYTECLIESVLRIDDSNELNPKISSTSEETHHEETGCDFASRCWRAQRLCWESSPMETDLGLGRCVRCHFPFSDKKTS